MSCTGTQAWIGYGITDSHFPCACGFLPTSEGIHDAGGGRWCVPYTLGPNEECCNGSGGLYDNPPECPNGYTYSSACSKCWKITAVEPYDYTLILDFCLRWSDTECEFQSQGSFPSSDCDSAYPISSGSYVFSYVPGYYSMCECCPACPTDNHFNVDLNDCYLDGSDCAAGTYWDGTACSATILQKGLSFVRHALTGRLYVAYIDSNNLKVDIYTDAQTDTVGSTVTVDASANCTAPKIVCRADGVLEIIYITGTNVKITQSSDSGTTWAVATTIVTSGYQLATYGIPATMSGYSIIPVMLWNDSKWYVKVGIKTGASTYTFSSAVQVATSAAALPATLLQRKDGVWEFLYTTLPNTKTMIRCKALRSDGTGTWS